MIHITPDMVDSVAAVRRGSAIEAGPGNTGHTAQVVVVTYSMVEGRPNQLLAMNASRFAAENLPRLIWVAYSPTRVDLVALIDDEPQSWARDTLSRRLGKWGARLCQDSAATTVRLDPSDWAWCLRSAERAARLALARLSATAGIDLHQCVAGEVCTCRLVGNQNPNASWAWMGERGALAGRLTDPPASIRAYQLDGRKSYEGGQR